VRNDNPLVCDDCDAPLSLEQYKLMGCCTSCEEKVRASWARMDQDYFERGCYE
jgi:uncharacterized CHY-type Zn-finger protein